MKQPFRVRRADRDGDFSRDDACVVQLVQVMHTRKVGPVVTALVGIDSDVRMFGRACVPQPHEDEQAQRKRGGGACGNLDGVKFKMKTHVHSDAKSLEDAILWVPIVEGAFQVLCHCTFVGLS